MASTSAIGVRPSYSGLAFGKALGETFDTAREQETKEREKRGRAEFLTKFLTANPDVARRFGYLQETDVPVDLPEYAEPGRMTERQVSPVGAEEGATVADFLRRSVEAGSRLREAHDLKMQEWAMEGKALSGVIDVMLQDPAVDQRQRLRLEGWKRGLEQGAFDPASIRELLKQSGRMTGIASLEEAVRMRDNLSKRGVETNIQPQMDEYGQWSYRLEAYAPGIERSIIDESKRKYPGDSAKQLDYQIEQKAKAAGVTVREQTKERPLGEAQQTALGIMTGILSSVRALREFTPDEIKAYAGWAQRGLKDIRQFAAGLPFSPVKADERYAQFRALTGRLRGTAFGEGGKQLTPMEESVVRAYTPYGTEAGGYTEFMAKAQNLELFTRIMMRARLAFAKTGRTHLEDIEGYERLLQEEMARVGFKPPAVEAPAPPGQGKTPPPAAPSGEEEWVRDPKTGKLTRKR